jgi:hypothetical protein
MRTLLAGALAVRMALLAVAVSSCGVAMPLLRSENKLQEIAVGTRRDEVLSKIGKPDTVRTSKVTSEGVLQVDEYRLSSTSDAFTALALGIPTVTISWWVDFTGPGKPYWLYYENGILHQWGRPGDFSPSQDIRIQFGEVVK